jgi:hypothetical protein
MERLKDFSNRNLILDDECGSSLYLNLLTDEEVPHIGLAPVRKEGL